MEFAISLIKMVRFPRSKKQTYQLNTRAQMGPTGLTLAMTLTLNFQGQIWNLLYLSQNWSDSHKTKNKYINWTLRLKWDHEVWPWPWPWPIENLLYLGQKWSDCPKTKFRHTDLMLGGKSAVAVLCNDEPCEPDISDNDQGKFRCPSAVDASSLIYLYIQVYSLHHAILT